MLADSPTPDRSARLIRLTRSTAVRTSICVASLALATALAWAVDGAVSLASQALIYLLPVVFTAVYLRSADAVITAVLGVTLLNFLFIPPRYTFLVEGPEYLISLGALLGVSLVVSGLVARLKRQTAVARLGEARMAALAELGQALAGTDKEPDIAARGVAAVAAAFGCAAEIRVIARDEKQVIRASSPQDGSIRIDEDALRWAMEHHSPLGPGTRNWPASAICAIPLSAEAHCFGAVAVDLAQLDHSWRADDLRHLESLGRLISAALQRARLAEAARRAAAEAEIESARSTLLASISHDLRTPLAVIIGSASMLREQGEQLAAERRAELLRTIETEATQMTTTAENVLQLARLSTGTMALRRDWESLEEIIGSVIARLRRRDPTRVFIARVPAALPLVRIDAVLIAQVVTNLLENAVTHGRDGGPVEVEVERREGVIEVAVNDRGPGLGDEDPARLFERGYRARVGRAAQDSRGAGLGLAICKAIVEAHGGTIAAANRGGGGASFRFTLPGSPDAPAVAVESGTAPAK